MIAAISTRQTGAIHTQLIITEPVDSPSKFIYRTGELAGWLTGHSGSRINNVMSVGAAAAVLAAIVGNFPDTEECYVH